LDSLLHTLRHADAPLQLQRPTVVAVNPMENDRKPGGAGAVRTQRHRTALRALVALGGLLVLVASTLALQLVPAGSARSRLDVPLRNRAPRPAAAAASVPPTTTATTTATTTTAGPLRVVEIGDSLGIDLGYAMEAWPSSAVHLTMAARGATGLSNTGYYDWQRALGHLLASTRPQVVVVFLGANDLQSIFAGPTVLYEETPAWDAAYAARVTAILSESVASGARVLWIGEPAMQKPFLSAGMALLDGIAQQVIAHYPGEAAYLSSDSVLAPGGTFAFDVSGPTGQLQRVRTPDGVHLMPAGADLLAAAVAQALANAWGMQVTGR
jgi:hypothetical protein